MLSREDPVVELWFLLSDENLEEMEQIYLLEREARRTTDALPLFIHLVPLNRVGQTTLPDATLLFERTVATAPTSEVQPRNEELAVA